MPQTITDLGRLAKQKYPGSYDDMTDEQLGKLVKAKYPGSYDDFADAPAQPVAPSGPPPDDRTAGQVAWDQTKEVAGGVKDFFTGIPGMVKEVAGIGYDSLTGNKVEAAKRAVGMMRGAAETIAAPVTPIIQTGLNEAGFDMPPATDEQWKRGARAAGTNTTGLILPEVVSGIRGGEGTFVSKGVNKLLPQADTLMGKAATLRSAVENSRATGIPTSRLGVVKSALHPAATGLASLAEKAAKIRGGRPLIETAGYAPETVGATFPDEQIPQVETPVRPSVVAADEARRAASWQPAENVPLTESEPVNVPYPQNPTNADYLQPPNPDIPVVPRDVLMAREAIAPSGTAAKLSTLRNIPDLLKEVPELAGTPKGPAFDAKLVNGFRAKEAALDAVEKSVPRETQVPIGNAKAALEELQGDYSAMGMNKAVRALEKLQAGIAEFPQAIPWDQFVEMKRAFFKEVSPSTAWARKAYRVLMDLSDQVSPELTKANRSYYIVRTALDNAKIDRFSGERIMNVGKPQK